MELTEEEQRIIDLRVQGLSIESIAQALLRGNDYTGQKIRSLAKRGLLPKVKVIRNKLAQAEAVVRVRNQSTRNKCFYKHCSMKASYNFALVDLCPVHHEMIWVETDEYYRGSLATKNGDARKHYNVIKHLIFWRREK